MTLFLRVFLMGTAALIAVFVFKILISDEAEKLKSTLVERIRENEA